MASLVGDDSNSRNSRPDSHPELLPHPKLSRFRGIALERLDKFVNVYLKETLLMTEVNGELSITSKVARFEPLSTEEAIRKTQGGSSVAEGAAASDTQVMVTTSCDHRLYRFDRVKFGGVLGAGADELLNGRTFTLVSVRGPRSFEINLHESQKKGNPADVSSMHGGVIAASVNMYKACPEVVIPQTITDERLVKITDEEVLARLRQNLVDPDKDLTLRSETPLPDAFGRTRPVCAELTVHGRLSPAGPCRRPYWARGPDRHAVWRTTAELGRAQAAAEELPWQEPVGEMEDRLWSLAGVRVGDVLVLRRGVAYAELEDDGDADDFVSHWWGEDTPMFLATLRKHERDVVEAEAAQGLAPRHSEGGRRKYVCTLVNRQHRVELGSWSSWETFIFYDVLRELSRRSGYVALTLDPNATPLRRIWCIFEAWVCAQNNIRYGLYTPDGDMNACMRDDEQHVRQRAMGLQQLLMELDLRDAMTSVEDDRQNILRLIEESPGGIQRVEYVVKRQIMDVQTIMTSLQRSRDPLTAEALRVPALAGQESDMVPRSLRRRYLGPWGFVEHRVLRISPRPVSVEEFFHGVLGSSPTSRLLVHAKAGAGKTALAIGLMRLASAQSKGERVAVCVPAAGLARKILERQEEETAKQALLRSGNATMRGRAFEAWHEKAEEGAAEDPLASWLRDAFQEDSRYFLDTEDRRGMLLILDGLAASLDSLVVVSWLADWTRRRRAEGCKDQVVIMSRPEVPLPVRRELRSLGFAFYALDAFRVDDAKVLVRRIAGEEAAGSLSGLDRKLYETPLMASFLGHYFYRGVAKAAEAGLVHNRSVGRAAVMDFMRDSFRGQAARVLGVPAGQADGLLAALAWGATAQRNPDGSGFRRAKSRAISRADFEAACSGAGLDAGMTKKAITCATRGELRALEPLRQLGAVQFTHEMVQVYLAACYIYEGPGDQEPFAMAWRSMSEISSIMNDGMGAVRELLAGLLASRAPRDEGLAKPRQVEYPFLARVGGGSSYSWLMLAACTGHVGALRRGLELPGKEALEVGIALPRVLVAQKLRRIPGALWVLSLRSSWLGVVMALGLVFPSLAAILGYPFFLLGCGSLWMLPWAESDAGLAVAIFVTVVGGISLLLNLETLPSPFRVLPFAMVPVIWLFGSVFNILLLPLVLVFSPLLACLGTLPCYSLIGILHSTGLLGLLGDNYIVKGAPQESVLLEIIHPWMQVFVQVLILLASIAAVVGLAVPPF